MSIKFLCSSQLATQKVGFLQTLSNKRLTNVFTSQLKRRDLKKRFCGCIHWVVYPVCSASGHCNDGCKKRIDLHKCTHFQHYDGHEDEVQASLEFKFTSKWIGNRRLKEVGGRSKRCCQYSIKYRENLAYLHFCLIFP